MAEIDSARPPDRRPPPRCAAFGGAPLAVVTGARGFLGAEIARALSPVRGIGRTANPQNPHVHEWVAADLSGEVPPETLAGADVVVHAAAETAGGYDAHQRNTIDATRHLLHAMHAAGVSRLVLVSSLSVLQTAAHAVGAPGRAHAAAGRSRVARAVRLGQVPAGGARRARSARAGDRDPDHPSRRAGRRARPDAAGPDGPACSSAAGTSALGRPRSADRRVRRRTLRRRHRLVRDALRRGAADRQPVRSRGDDTAARSSRGCANAAGTAGWSGSRSARRAGSARGPRGPVARPRRTTRTPRDVVRVSPASTLRRPGRHGGARGCPA